MKIIGILAAIVLLALIVFYASKTATSSQPTVVCYASLDEEFSRPILEKFEKDTGIRIDMVFDTESTKSIGLMTRLKTEHEQSAAKCDVFWNNEVMNTVRLKRLGVLEKYAPEAAAKFPKSFRDPDGTWVGFAARARVLLVNTDMVKPEEYPQTLKDLLNPKWKGQIGIAKPYAGSTASWVTALYDISKNIVKENQQSANPLSDKDLMLPTGILIALKEKYGLQVYGGNKQTAQAVAAGKLAMAFTDTDDALVEKESGKPVELVYIGGAKDGHGAMFFPNTLSMIKNCPHPENAKKLIDYLLSPEVEIALAKGPSAQIPINPEIKVKIRTETPATIKAMDIDWEAVTDEYQAALTWMKGIIGE